MSLVLHLPLISTEFTCTQDIKPERDLCAVFQVTKLGRELVVLSKDLRLYADLEDITGNLTRSDWAYLLRAVNQHVTEFAHDLGIALEGET